VRPIDLTPKSVAVVATKSGSSSRQALGVGMALIAVLGVSAYFMLARVNSIKEETNDFQSQVTAIQGEQEGVRKELEALGQKPTAVGWSTVADTYTKDVIEKVTGGDDYGKLLRDLSIGTSSVRGAWFTNVSVGAVGDAAAAAGSEGDGSRSINISGYAPSVTAVMSLINNLNATASIADAKVKSVSLVETRSGAPYRKFDLTASFSAKIGSVAGRDGLVSSGSAELALEPKPAPRSRTSAKKPPVAKPVVRTDLTGVAGLAQDTSGKRGSA
jgi:hypothetical protein